ncbi:MAG TPA: hypothetical protein VLZ55_09260, partial [Rhodanobacter sp.]|nr:hypothetical protein [Rhodanobacter sp.]
LLHPVYGLAVGCLPHGDGLIGPESLAVVGCGQLVWWEVALIRAMHQIAARDADGSVPRCRGANVRSGW